MRTKNEQIGLRIDLETKNRLERMSQRQTRSLAQQVLHYIKKGLEADEANLPGRTDLRKSNPTED